MKVLFLAAGFSTRLKPLTDNFPKGLLEVQGKPIIGRLLESALQLTEVDEWAMITNHVCFPHYQQYVEENHFPVRVLNNGVSQIDQRLGAIGDLQLSLNLLQWQDDVLILPSDTLVSISLAHLLSFFNQHHEFTNVVYDIKDKNKIKDQLGCVVLTGNQISDFQEKPTEPKSTITSVPIYLYPRHSLPLIQQFLTETHNGDSPGSIIPWLLHKISVRGYLLENGYYYDVGTKEMYQQMVSHPELFLTEKQTKNNV